MIATAMRRGFSGKDKDKDFDVALGFFAMLSQ